VGVSSTARQERSLTPSALRQLLEWLDEGVESHGERYLEMRRRLVAYFDRRNRPSPDELADETLNRVARTLEESGGIGITPPARYCYVVARFILLEDLRRREHGYVRLDEPRSCEGTLGLSVSDTPDEAAVQRERRFACLDRCLEKLKPEQRELIVEYYRDARREKIERRRALAARMGISMNALAVRACRIRDLLEACVGSCCKEGDRF
jgi:DNA-directed RNA polymerase specialized sigma24 family protein